jgi:hypothetical protein
MTQQTFPKAILQSLTESRGVMAYGQPGDLLLAISDFKKGPKSFCSPR